MASLITFKLSDESLKKIKDAEKIFSEKQINTAIKQSLNEGARHGMSQAQKSIRKVFAFKQSTLIGEDSKGNKPLSVKVASVDKLEAAVYASHIPIPLNVVPQTVRYTTESEKTKTEHEQLLSFRQKHLKTTKTGKTRIPLLSVKVYKGPFKSIRSAFNMGNENTAEEGGSIVYAHGLRKKPQFVFLTAHNSPIKSLSTISVYTAMLNSKVRELYEGDISEYTNKRLIRSLNRLIEGKWK